MAEPARTTTRTSRSSTCSSVPPPGGQASSVAIVRLRAPERAAPHRSEQVDGRRPRARAAGLEAELSQLLLRHELLDQREQAALLEPDVRLHLLGELPHRGGVRPAGRQPAAEAAGEGVEALVLEQRLDEARLHRPPRPRAAGRAAPPPRGSAARSRSRRTRGSARRRPGVRRRRRRRRGAAGVPPRARGGGRAREGRGTNAASSALVRHGEPGVTAGRFIKNGAS